MASFKKMCISGIWRRRGGDTIFKSEKKKKKQEKLYMVKVKKYVNKYNISNQSLWHFNLDLVEDLLGGSIPRMQVSIMEKRIR